MKTFNDNRKGTGTREWAETSYNICTGCAHNCRYCYASAMARRFGRATLATWPSETVDLGKVAASKRKHKGVVMFPTTHDITPSILGHCLSTLRNLVEAGNPVLIVSKPHRECIEAVCAELADRKSKVLFRFTIGTGNAAVASFWEPGAPAPQERLESLRLAFTLGFSTSVSMEPMLESMDDMIRLVATVTPHVTDTIWLGKMNRVAERVAQESPEARRRVEMIHAQQTDAEIFRLVAALRHNPKVRWKDSIKEVCAAARRNNEHCQDSTEQPLLAL